MHEGETLENIPREWSGGGVSTDLSLAPPSSGGKEPPRVEDGESNSKLRFSARNRSSMGASDELNESRPQVPSFSLQPVEATKPPQAHFTRSSSVQELLTLATLETGPLSPFRRALTFPKNHVPKPYAAASHQPTEQSKRASSPVLSQPSSAVTFDSLAPSFGPRTSFEAGQPQHKERREEPGKVERFGEQSLITRSLQPGSFRRGFEPGGDGRGFEPRGPARGFVPERETIQVLSANVPSGFMGRTAAPAVWDLNSAEQAMEQAAREGASARAGAIALPLKHAHPPAIVMGARAEATAVPLAPAQGSFAARMPVWPGARGASTTGYDLGLGKEGRKRDFGMTVVRPNLVTAAAESAPAASQNPLLEAGSKLFQAGFVSGYEATAAGRARPPSDEARSGEARKLTLCKVVDPRTGFLGPTVDMWAPPVGVPEGAAAQGAPRPPSDPFTRTLPHSGGLFFTGPVATGTPGGATRLEVLAAAAEHATDGNLAGQTLSGGTHRSGEAAGNPQQGGNLFGAFRAYQQRVHGSEETSVRGGVPRLNPVALPSGFRDPQRGAVPLPLPVPVPVPEVVPEGPPGAGQVFRPWHVLPRPFAIPPPLNLEQEMRLAKEGNKRAESSHDSEEQPRKRRTKEGQVAEPTGQVYNCRFCGQAFDRPTALGGHMNCHKEERREEKMRESLETLSSGRPPGRLFVAWGPFHRSDE
ncbi:hypothetical protein KFL_000760160 [Klebsormidium nitens]|uniref:C2H2-type domain-containing protein n=1 Tax=Klebsormidium nitens TaxID=105231 RepID=A0A1Y1HXM1_KLENI|nr:hypothetical protein KFL_000760160 [Klebsormidium nitens]|eukprot:GAQ81287.1 hypothetical protein KFL_000760160 [Klebsormidium nitens]